MNTINNSYPPHTNRGIITLMTTFKNNFIQTCISHNFARNLLVTASGAEDLATNTTVVPPAEGVELVTTFVALFTVRIRHPVLLEVTVLVRLRCLGENKHFCS